MRVRIYNQLDRWSLRAAARVVTVSRAFREELRRKGIPADRIEVVHNAIAPGWGDATRAAGGAGLRERLGIGPGRKIVLSVGRLSREKDHHTLLQSLQRLAADAGDGRAEAPHLLLVGDGPERPRIEQSVAALGLGGSVTLTGQVPSAEPYYGIADVCVLSSLSEGSPNALLEAMSAGVPVVATAVGGVPEIVSHGESALLAPPGDPGALSRELGRLLRDEALALRLSAGARDIILSRHTPASRASRLVEIYRMVCRPSRVAGRPE